MESVAALDVLICRSPYQSVFPLIVILYTHSAHQYAQYVEIVIRYKKPKCIKQDACCSKFNTRIHVVFMELGIIPENIQGQQQNQKAVGIYAHPCST